MITKVQKWGNSQGLRISKEILGKTHLAIGDAVNVVVQRGTIMVQPANRIRGKYSLRELIAQMPRDYKPVQEEWGGAVGKEVW